MSNENSLVQYEDGVTPYAMSVLPDSGDHLTFTSSASYFSIEGSNSPIVRPNGVLTGATATPAASLTNDLIDVAQSSVNLNGVVTTVAVSLDLTVARAASDVASISSITVTNGGVYAMVKGVDSLSSAFSEARGAAGGPPFIPVDSIEIGQIRVTTDTAAAIAPAEIFQVDGTHLETAAFPSHTVNNLDATVIFSSSLGTAHTGGISKAVHASYADPILVDQDCANDFVPASNSHSVTSEQVYGKTIGTSSSSLGQASFTAILSNGITDSIVNKQNKTLLVKYYQDITKTPHIVTQGKIGVARTFAAADNPKGSITISASTESVNVA